jgi:hypothetical protein
MLRGLLEGEGQFEQHRFAPVLTKEGKTLWQPRDIPGRDRQTAADFREQASSLSDLAQGNCASACYSNLFALLMKS